MSVTKESIIIVGVVAVLVIVFSIVSTPSFMSSRKNNQSGAPVTPASPTAGQLAIYDGTIGTGAEAVSGKLVTVQYTGTLANGTKFDSSYDRGIPFTFLLGGGQVIPGWDRGVQGMKVGGKRRLVIPSELAYGPNGIKDASGNFVIPPNATLTFEVELLGVKDATPTKK
ncbi:MAG: FKBP-type peptidyl-prolyl cis-trans isomerase [Patescibacteria group bacterium]